MVAAVEERDLEVDHRIARQISASGRLMDSLLDRRDVLPWDRPAKDIVHKDNAAAPRQRFHTDLAVAKLAMSASLLLMTALRLGMPADGLAIGHLRGLQGHFRMIAALQPGNDGLDMRLPCPGDQKLVRLRVAEEPYHLIFFHQLMEGRAELVFIGAGL